MKTIAVISNVGWTVYNFRKGIITYLIAKGFKVIVFTKFDQYVPRLEELGCTCIPINNMDFKGMNPLKDIKLIKEFYSLFKKNKVDTALFYTPKVNIYGSIAARYTNTKCIPTINGLGTIFNPEQNVFIQKIVKKLYRFALQKVPLVFFQNADDKDFFIANNMIASHDKTKVVKGSGVNTIDFYQKNYPVKKDDLVFAFAARLLKEKGIFEFIEAAKSIKEKYANVSFAIIGSSSFFPGNIDEQKITDAERQGIIKFWGGTDNMSKTLDNVDVLVLPSYYREGVPRILIEGLSKGLPIITTDNIGCRETVDEGKNGYLIEVKNANALIMAIEKMILSTHEQRMKMGAYSRQKAENECAEEIIFSEYYQAIMQ